MVQKGSDWLLQIHCRYLLHHLTTVSPKEFDNFIEDYLKTEEVDAFVIGYPVQMNNQPSESVKYINPFIKKLKKTLP